MSHLAILIAASTPVAAQAAVTQIGPFPYLSAADSPFASDPTLLTSIEDFEDGDLNTPGIANVALPSDPPGTFLGVVVEPGPDTDSVDGDDGIIDGLGRAGHSFRSTRFGQLLNGDYESIVYFDFLPDSRGNYPTAFGFVWTDGERGIGLGSGVEIIGREIDRSGNFFVPADLGPVTVGDGTFTGETTEDRFLGVTSSTGITFALIRYISFVRFNPPNFNISN